MYCFYSINKIIKQKLFSINNIPDVEGNTLDFERRDGNLDVIVGVPFD
jgi:DNA-dependent RNA polymerase auxiliary subunit epsilon